MVSIYQAPIEPLGVDVIPALPAATSRPGPTASREEGQDRSAGREPSLDDVARTVGIAVKEADANREDLVEAALPQVEVLEVRDEELGFAGFYVRRVSACRGFDHLG